MKRLLKPLLILGFGVIVGLTIGFFFGAHWGSSTACVSLALFNSTSRPISSVRITHEHGVELVGEIQPAHTRTATFIARGETSYALAISFTDGSHLETEPRYAESGYRVTERIRDDSVETDDHALY